MNKKNYLVFDGMSTERTFFFLLTLLLLSGGFALMQVHDNNLSSYEMGYAVGALFKRMLWYIMLMEAIYRVVSWCIKPRIL